MESFPFSYEIMEDSTEDSTKYMENLGAFDPALYTRRMTTAQKPSTAYITERLQAGAKPGEVIKEGYSSSTVYGVANKLKKGQATPQEDGAPLVGPSQPFQNRKGRTTPTSNSTGTRARITQEEIIIPGHIFLWYDLMREAFPEYTATKTEWLEDVVETWATDYGEPIRQEYLRDQGVDPMTLTYEGDEELGATEMETMVGVDAASPGDEPGEPDVGADGSSDGADPAEDSPGRGQRRKWAG